MTDLTKLTDEQLRAMDEAIALLRKHDLYPATLDAYATALDLPDQAAEFNDGSDENDEAARMSIADVISCNIDSDVEDGRDAAIDFWDSVYKLAVRVYGQAEVDRTR